MLIATALYKSLLLKYEYQIADAQARLKIYFDNPVAIGEHPQHTEEIDKLLGTLSSAEGKKSTLEKHFKEEYEKINGIN